MEVADQRLLIRTIPEYDELIPMNALEKEIIEGVPRFTGFHRDIGMTPPIVLMLSLVGVKNCALTISDLSWTDTKIDRDVLMAPDILIEDYSFQADVLVRPALDFIWQSAGAAECPNYDQNGRWIRR